MDGWNQLGDYPPQRPSPSLQKVCRSTEFPPTSPRSRGAIAYGRLVWSLSWALLMIGCGYVVGDNFVPHVRSVEVPIFENQTYRRGLEYQLTEAVQQEIQRRTPYRLARGSQADTRLIGKIVSVRKDVLSETAFDDPRELQLGLAVQVTWLDQRSGQILAQQHWPLDDQFFTLSAQAEFAPELGQSLATATHEAVHQLARQIVNMMEQPW
ncbi:MAG: hypothetical protein KatS3mg114_0634 [Planctomycetaceae bacterium]|nr:MAG: hypothetical protein KatS3mg114_0634 [Planctomycetaceae bacterium]